jgi:hypothetical protein
LLPGTHIGPPPPPAIPPPPIPPVPPPPPPIPPVALPPSPPLPPPLELLDEVPELVDVCVPLSEQLGKSASAAQSDTEANGEAVRLVFMTAPCITIGTERQGRRDFESRSRKKLASASG